MRRENLGDGAGATLLVGLDALKEGYVRIGIVPSLVRILQAEEIGFTLCVTAELQVGDRDSKARGFVDTVACPATGAEKHERDHGELHGLAFGSVLRAVTRSNVGDLVGHHAGEFGLFLGAQNEAAVYVEKPAGKGEGVDFIGIDYLDCEGHARIGIADQILADAVHVFRDDGIIDKFGGALDFLGERFAEGNFVFKRIEIDPFADVAITDVVDVFLGVLGMDSVLLGNRLILRRLGFRRLRSQQAEVGRAAEECACWSGVWPGCDAGVGCCAAGGCGV